MIFVMKNKKKRIWIGAMTLIVLLAVLAKMFFGLTDLRPKNLEYPNNNLKAKDLMEQMGKAHAIEVWDSITGYQVTFSEEFYGVLGKMNDPFENSTSELFLNYVAGSPIGMLSFKSGKEQVSWGYRSGKTYRIDDDEKPNLESNKKMHFWIPTYQYFIELPMKIQEATVLDYTGTKEINGIQTEGLLASWDTLEPQPDIDQYLIWLDSDTHRIVKVEYTIRELYPFITGAAYFQNYKEFHGLPLPSDMPVESNLVKDGFLHRMGIMDFKVNNAFKMPYR